MNLRLIGLLLVLAVAGVCCVVILAVMPEPSPTSFTAPLGNPARERVEKPAAAQEDPAGYDQIAVKIIIPPMSEFPPSWEAGAGCAHIQLSKILGAALSQGNGVVVFVVEPGKPAAEAGIKPGDRLGEPGDCPRTLVGAFLPGRETRTLDWTVRRPRSAEFREKAAKEAAEHPMVSPSVPKAGPGARPRASGSVAITKPPRPAAARRSPRWRSPTTFRSADRPR
jgi:hypothetical protein